MIYSKRVQEAVAAGFTLDEVKQGAYEEYNQGVAAGFTPAEMLDVLNKDYGLRPAPQNGETEQAVSFASLMFADTSGSENQSNASSVVDAFYAGYQNSVTGLIARGANPNIVLQADAPLGQKIAQVLGQTIGDLPSLALGAMGGGLAGAPTGPGAVMSASAAAMGVTEGLRAYLVDSYANGMATTPMEAFDRSIKTLVATGKGAFIGGATGGATIGAKMLASEAGYGVVRSAVTTSTAELAALTTATTAMHGQLPTADEFVVNAITLGGLKGATFYGQKLGNIFVNTGKSPNAVRADSLVDPTIRADMAAVNLEAPQAYRSSWRRLFAVDGIDGEVYTSKAAAERAANGAGVSEYQMHRNAPVIKYNDSMAAKMFRQFMETPEGRASLEKMDPTFFQEYPDFFEKYQSATQERLVPTARKMFENPTPEFSEFLRSEFDSQTVRQMSGGSHGNIDGTISVDWAGIRMGDKIVPLKQEAIMSARDKPTGNLKLDQAREHMDTVLSIGEKTGQLGVMSKIRQTYQSYADKFSPLNVAADRTKISEPYFMSRMAAGSPGIAMHWMEQGVTKYGSQEITGKSLRSILKQVDDPAEFSRYLVAKRAKELSEQGIETDVNVEAAYTIANDKGMQARFEAAAQDIYAYNKAIIDYTYDGGLISKRQYDAMQSKNKAYVPLTKLLETFEPELKRIAELEGNTKSIQDPLESMIRSTFVAIRLTEQNAAKVSIAKAFGTPLANKSKVADPLHSSGSSAAMEVRYYENGRMRVSSVPKEIAETARLLDSETLQIYSSITKVLAQGAGVLRAGAVLSPDFIMRNPIRDQFAAAINSNNGYVFGLDALRGIGAVINERTGGKLFKQFDGVMAEWTRNGGANASLVSLDRTYSQDIIRQLTRQPMLNVVRNPVKHYRDILGMINPLKAPTHVLNALRGLSEYSELGTRLGEYMRARERGLTAKEAAYASREVTIDFMRIGAQTKSLNAISAFFNAKIQGPDRILRGLANDPLGYMAKAAAGIALPTMMLSIVNNDILRNSPDSELAEALRQVPQWQKTAAWLLPIGGSFILRIPKPPDWAIMMCAPIEIFIDHYSGNSGESLLDSLNDAGFLGNVAELAVPNPLPSLVTPAIEVTSNYSFFTGANIVPTFMENLSPEVQYRAGTTETAKVLANVMSKIDPLVGTPVMERLGSPIMIDHLVNGWTGTLGRYAMQLTDWALATSGIVNPVEKPTKSLAELPVLRAFLVKYPSAAAKDIDMFNKEAGYYEKRLNTVKALFKEGNDTATTRAQEMLLEGGVARFTGIRESMGNISRYIRMVNFSDRIDPDTKRQLIEDSYIHMIQLAKEGRRMIKEVKHAGNE